MPCRLIAQPEEVGEILVVDGGSVDQTRSIVDIYRLRDARVKWIDASPIDSRWTGKAWGLDFGLIRSDPSSQWILCIDADVRIGPELARYWPTRPVPGYQRFRSQRANIFRELSKLLSILLF
jgi:glycosyltransferase involved in cell wall biosynthesis